MSRYVNTNILQFNYGLVMKAMTYMRNLNFAILCLDYKVYKLIAFCFAYCFNNLFK